MTTFLLYRTPQQKQRKKQLLILQIVLALGLLVLLIVTPGRRNGSSSEFIIPPFIFLLIAVNVLVSVYTTWRDLGKTRYAAMDETGINWQVFEKNLPRVSVAWNDVQWMKMEGDAGIHFFLASSFRYSLPLTDFSAEDREALKRLALDYAAQHNIRVVNASPVAA